jgi:hypothetical protein
MPTRHQRGEAKARCEYSVNVTAAKSSCSSAPGSDHPCVAGGVGLLVWRAACARRAPRARQAVEAQLQCESVSEPHCTPVGAAAGAAAAAAAVTLLPLLVLASCAAGAALSQPLVLSTSTDSRRFASVMESSLRTVFVVECVCCEGASRCIMASRRLRDARMQPLLTVHTSCASPALAATQPTTGPHMHTGCDAHTTLRTAQQHQAQMHARQLRSRAAHLGRTAVHSDAAVPLPAWHLQLSSVHLRVCSRLLCSSTLFRDRGLASKDRRFATSLPSAVFLGSRKSGSRMVAVV